MLTFKLEAAQWSTAAEEWEHLHPLCHWDSGMTMAPSPFSIFVCVCMWGVDSLLRL